MLNTPFQITVYPHTMFIMFKSDVFTVFNTYLGLNAATLK